MEKNNKIITGQIINFSRYNTDKDGKPLVTKKGENYHKFSIKVDKAGDKVWYGTDFKDDTKDFKVGDTVTIETYEREYQGKWYDSARIPTKTDLMWAMLQELNDRVKKLENKKELTGVEKTFAEMGGDDFVPTDF